eukprot:CAMPEP_0174356350 /NCGR_PEP_ID=MMETSP0811_2-20130205/30438_1 /TAXON_ID=73025 ORGANISM="Eutreptiella gymnastica-like, Strain CCMP1594" /NCGR_SAMPLE_ID=MMETSP0811_2 /ASSEMBLY_ACC=CAM_ASM_000667 /LENGTH=64 /DNA_ID=CAMNT_0015488377 /DNA_START=107 /DNA_END=301 /DNA_ORIENTATION=-
MTLMQIKVNTLQQNNVPRFCNTETHNPPHGTSGTRAALLDSTPMMHLPWAVDQIPGDTQVRKLC